MAFDDIAVGFSCFGAGVSTYWARRATELGWHVSAFMLLRSLDGIRAFVGNKLNLYHQNTRDLRVHLASAVFGIAAIGCLELPGRRHLVFDPCRPCSEWRRSFRQSQIQLGL